MGYCEKPDHYLRPMQLILYLCCLIIKGEDMKYFKRFFLLSAIVLFAVACKKTEFSPEGPTDVRVRNLTTFALYELTVDIDSVAVFGSLDAQSTSQYIRFPKAYPKATISAKINKGGTLTTFSTEKFDYTYMQYMGQMKITYEIFIPQADKNVFDVKVVADEPLILE